MKIYKLNKDLTLDNLVTGRKDANMPSVTAAEYMARWYFERYRIISSLPQYRIAL